MTSETPPPLARVRALLQVGPFRRYMMGEGVSLTGTWMQVMAQGWVMTTLTDKALMLGLVNFAAGVPMIALTMLGGSVADRCDKRKILLATQIVQIAFAITMGVLVAHHAIRIWHVLVVSALLGVSTAFEMPAAAALVPELVPSDQIAAAVGFDRSLFHGTRLIGPAIGGFVVGLWGTAAAFFANAGSFVALMAALLSLPARPPGTVEEESKRASGMKDGIRYVRADKPTLSMIMLIAVTTVFVFPIMTVMMPLYARNILGLGPDRMGLLMAVSGIGSLTGSVGLLSVARDKRLVFITAGVAAVIGAMAGLATAHSFYTAALSLIGLTLGLSFNIGLANTIVQERAPSHLRGRVSAIAGLSFFGLMPLAGLVVTSLSDFAGMRTALGAAAACYAICAAFVLTGAGRRACVETVLVTSAAPVI